MPYEEILGLLIGMAVVVAIIGYLAAVYRHPQRFDRLDVPREEPYPHARPARAHRHAA